MEPRQPHSLQGVLWCQVDGPSAGPSSRVINKPSVTGAQPRGLLVFVW